MRARILIPVKPLASGKSRLASVLDDSGRVSLCERFFRNALSLALGVAPTIVVTLDARVAGIARQAGARALLEPRDLGLNGALDYARTCLDECEPLVVLPIDLPHLSAAGLEALCCEDDAVTIATDRAQTGTNVLVLPRGAAREFRFAFGSGSAAAHRAEALRLGVPVWTRLLPQAAFDVDLPEDYALLASRSAGESSKVAKLWESP